MLVAVISSLVSVIASAAVTWYFSKRHYEGSRGPVTENDIVLRDNENGFRFFVIVVVAGSLLLAMMILVTTFGPERTPMEEEQENVTTGTYSDLLGLAGRIVPSDVVTGSPADLASRVLAPRLLARLNAHTPINNGTPVR